tara:strand:- start:1155 stop:1715 length:561 start_codon:yes stop_codon:yes gene_type:complete
LYGQADTSNIQHYILSGTVVNGVNNEPLSGAHLLSSKGLATKTNEIGSFDITVAENDTLVISYIGFKTLTFIAPKNNIGKYLTKFSLYKDSINLKEIEIFPWPTYDDFKKAFEELDFKNQEIKMAGVKMYKDRNIEPWEFNTLSILTHPLSFMYDKLLDKKAKLKRRINRRRETIEKAAQKQSLEN